jgi:hypothetical protein
LDADVPTRDEINPGDRLGVEVEVGEMTGREVSGFDTSRVDVDEGSAACAETVPVRAVLVEIGTAERSAVEVDAGATTCIDVSCVDADAAGAP